jgi:ABC-type Fe3+-hydroxamate transport system substrate-binding protein
MVHTRLITDQLNRTIEVPLHPQRIVSLVPSQTELLYDLGLTHEVVGQTLFCIHPHTMHQEKTRVGGTKNVKLEVIDALKPDLIIGNKEENNQENIEQLMKKYPVWMSDIKTLPQALHMIYDVGNLVGKAEMAQTIAQRISQQFNELTPYPKPLKVAYFIWRNPWMVAGNDTFINDMLKRLGFANVFEAENGRYPSVTLEQVKSTSPNIILLSSEPYPFKQKHINELQQYCPNAHIILVDGELFSWYGSRLIHSVAYFQQLLSSITFK